MGHCWHGYGGGRCRDNQHTVEGWLKLSGDERFAELPTARGAVRGVVEAPGSKSLTNRALLTAALAQGESLLSGALFSDDTRYMSQALLSAGVEVDADEAGSQFRVVSRGGGPGPVAEPIFVGNAGTAMRFLCSYFALGEGTYVLDGAPRMRERPIQELVDALNQLGGRVEAAPGTGCPPVRIEAIGLRGGLAKIPGERSSQFLSSLLLSAPYARQVVDLEVVGELASRPYVDLTAGVMRAFGVEVENDAYRQFRVRPGQYRACRYSVEPDASSASYFLAAAAVTGGEVTVRGLSTQSTQGDIEFVRILEQMGCVAWNSESGLTLAAGSRLEGVDVDMRDCSDVALTLACAAPFASSPTTVRNVAHMRLQETDRIHAITRELERAGITVEEREDGFTVHPAQPLAARFETYEDHRMAMSLSLIGLRTPGCSVVDPGCVSKTFPGYFGVLRKLVG